MADLVWEKAGMSYRCARCDVFGYLCVGERRACWCCDDNDQIVRR
jgi:hypothetical protein